MKALVTGSASGIGAACVERLERAGFEVIGWDIEVDPAVDVTSSTSVAEAAARIDGELDAVVLAAGVSRMASITETSDEDWNFQMNVNAFGVFNCLRSLYPLMREGGAMVAIDSIAGLRGAPLLGAYCASKHAVTALVETAVLEFAPRRVRVNAVCPMYVRTPMQHRELEWEGEQRGIAPEAVLAEYEKRVPAGRVAEPSEIADVAYYLLSEESSYVNGGVIPVSGGGHLSR